MPRGKLRRDDRAMEATQCRSLLGRALVGRVATSGPDGAPYVVPLNFAYEAASETVFVHCATSGHLLDNLANDPRVCFEVDEPGEVIATGEYACDTSQVYSSVICFGRARLLSTDSERRAALQRIIERYVDRLMPDRRYDPELTTLDTTVAIAIQVDTMTGKRRVAP